MFEVDGAVGTEALEDRERLDEDFRGDSIGKGLTNPGDETGAGGFAERGRFAVDPAVRHVSEDTVR